MNELSRRPADRRDLLLIRSFAICAALVVGLSWWALALRSMPASIMGFCPSGNPTAVHVILLGPSPDLSGDQVEAVKTLARKVILAAKPLSRVDVYGVGSGRQSVRGCRPAPSRTWIERMIGDDAAKERRFQEELYNEVQRLLTGPTKTMDAPILESIRAVCLRSVIGLPTEVLSTLLLASDLVQRSPIMDHTKAYSARDLQSPPVRAASFADCHGAKLSLVYLLSPRYGQIQDASHLDFWIAAFSNVSLLLIPSVNVIVI